MSLERSSEINGGVVTETNRQYAINIESLDPMNESHPPGCKCMLAKCVLMQALINGELEPSLEEEIIDIT